MAKRGVNTTVSYWKITLAIIILVVVLYGAWHLFFSATVTCEDRGCLNLHLGECSKARYTGGSEMIYTYTILGGSSSGEFCDVDVELVQGELNNQESMTLEGKHMLCSLPLGVVMNPESDIANCHGELKEGLQDLIIQKLYAYLVQNVGRINLEALDFPGS